jgi:rod shape-determining protein MreD
MSLLRAVAAIAAMITAFLIQATVIDPFTVTVAVSLPAVVVAAVALVDGPAAGMSFGFTAGLLADLGSTHPAGVLALTWTGLGVLCGVAAQRRSVRGDAGVAAVCCALAAVFAGLVLGVVHGDGAVVWQAIRDGVPAGVGDLMLAVLVVPVVRAFLRSEALRARHPAFTELNVARHG